jgi:hypothetical protein
VSPKRLVERPSSVHAAAIIPTPDLEGTVSSLSFWGGFISLAPPGSCPERKKGPDTLASGPSYKSSAYMYRMSANDPIEAPVRRR